MDFVLSHYHANEFAAKTSSHQFWNDWASRRSASSITCDTLGRQRVGKIGWPLISMYSDQSVNFGGSPRSLEKLNDRHHWQKYYSVDVCLCIFANLRLFVQKDVTAPILVPASGIKQMSTGNSYLKDCSFIESFEDFSQLSGKIACRQYNQSARWVITRNESVFRH